MTLHLNQMSRNLLLCKHFSCSVSSIRTVFYYVSRFSIAFSLRLKTLQSIQSFCINECNVICILPQARKITRNGPHVKGNTPSRIINHNGIFNRVEYKRITDKCIFIA